uniref:uncharacterized protein isoform X2 n=1 Tax=Myxine glutinosa TaxID=7769 RepID=UPI00358EA8E2
MERTLESGRAAPASRWPDDMIKGTYQIDVSLPLPKHLPRPWSSEEEIVIHVTIRHFQDPADESTGLKITASVTLPSDHYQTEQAFAVKMNFAEEKMTTAATSADPEMAPLPSTVSCASTQPKDNSSTPHNQIVLQPSNQNIEREEEQLNLPGAIEGNEEGGHFSPKVRAFGEMYIGLEMDREEAQFEVHSESSKMSTGITNHQENNTSSHSAVKDQETQLSMKNVMLPNVLDNELEKLNHLECAENYEDTITKPREGCYVEEEYIKGLKRKIGELDEQLETMNNSHEPVELESYSLVSRLWKQLEDLSCYASQLVEEKTQLRQHLVRLERELFAWRNEELAS